ncbi:MAG: hypothetical protein V3T65_05450 [Acidobacteriota bacterium]
MALTFAVIFLAVVIIYVLAPLYGRARAGEDILAPDVTPAVHLEEQRKVIYENVEDLEFEYQAGKLSQEDYQRTRQDYMTEAGDLMAQELELSSKSPAPRQVAEVRLPSPAASAARLCPLCGTPNSRKGKFCPECGTRLTDASA